VKALDRGRTDYSTGQAFITAKKRVLRDELTFPGKYKLSKLCSYKE